MRSTIRRTTVTILLTALLAPGLIHARTPVRHQPRASVSTPVLSEGFFSSVWNLLSNLLKTGPGLDPSGTPPPPSSATTDTGTQLDPSGGPK